MPEPYGIETAGAFGIGNAYIIVSLGNTDWNTAAGTVGLTYKVGDVFTAAAAGTGTGTARRLVNDSIGRIGGKLLADNLLRDGRDLAFDTDLLYLKVSPKVANTVSAGSFQIGVRYKILTTGNTNFLLIGSLSNAPGTIFTATGIGTGTGTADRLDDDALDPNPQSGTGRAVGFNLDNPAYDLEVSSNIDATEFAATSAAYISNFIISNTNRISTSFGGINIFMTGASPEARFDILASSGVFFNDNIIGSYTNQNIRLDPNGTGTIELQANTNAAGDIYVTGNIGITGNLSKQGNLILGDDVIDGEGNLPENDTVNFAMPFNQNLVPGIDLGYDLGGSLGDSTRGRWAQLHSPNWNNITTLIPSSATVSDQIFIGGALHELTSVQSNDDLILDPDTGILYIEELKFETRFQLKYVLDNPNAFGTPASDAFGQAVAISGNYVVVGAYFEDDAGGSGSGKVYIFDVTTGSLLHTLDNPNAFGTSVNDAFGQAVAISGNYVVVGVVNEDDAGGSVSGKAYIFDVTTGSLLHTLDNPNAFGTSDNDQFGIAVAISNNYALVGARFEDDAGGSGSGKAYIFSTATGALLTTLDNPNAFGTSASDAFGTAVAISNNYAIITAISEDDAGGSSSGKAYIFDVTTGSLLHTLDNPNAFGTSADDNFGVSVAISDNYVVVGAHLEDDAGGSGSGKAYIFDVTTGSLLHTLDNPNAFGTSADDQFGRRLAISDNYVVVGASSEDDAGGSGSGKAYIFSTATGALLTTLDNPNAFGTSAADVFGSAVAISGDYIISAALNEDETGNLSSGKVYVFALNQIVTNLNPTTPVKIATTGTGYYRFAGTNAILIPAGDDASRPSSPEIGDTRWNTDQGYLECFDGSVYVISTGGGIEVTQEIMNDLGHAYTLMLG